MRALAIALAFVSGCASLPADGVLMCGPDPAHQCPAGFECVDGSCYRDGHGPADMSIVGDVDMAQSDLADNSSTDMTYVCGASGQPCCATAPTCGTGLACFNSVCANADVWAMGAGNNVVLSNHWNGATWSSSSAVTPSGLLTPVMTRLWGSTSSDIWAVGWGEPVGPPSDQPPVPAVYRWQGNAWTFCPTASACAVPSSTILTNIFGFTASDIWVTANDGAYHWDGAVWSAKSTGMTTGPSTAQDIWCATTSDCWAVGEDSSQNILLQHWNGTTWSAGAHTAANAALQSVWGFASNDVWAVGGFNTANTPILIHWNGMEWGSTYFVANSSAMAAVWGAASNDVWAVGSSGNIAHWNGSGWTGTALGATVNCADVYGTSSKDVWISAGTAMLHWDGTSWTSTMPAGMNANMVGLWAPKP